jgi:hypothetical protein
MRLGARVALGRMQFVLHRRPTLSSREPAQSSANRSKAHDLADSSTEICATGVTNQCSTSGRSFRAPARALDLPTTGRSLILTPGWDMT